jgi:hypothetical protein
MKRQIFTALSLTLLISSPLTLNAGKNKKQKKAHKISLNEFLSDQQAPDKQPDISVLFDAASSPDEFSPDNTKVQRAALFAAIVAIEFKGKGLNHVDCFHELEREKAMKDIYTYEDTHTIITSPAVMTDAATQISPSPEFTERLAVNYLASRYRLKKTQAQLATAEERLNKLTTQHSATEQNPVDLFPEIPAPQPQQQDDFDKASVSSSTGHSLELPEELTTNNTTDAAPATTTTPPTSTLEPASQTNFMWRILGYK